MKYIVRKGTKLFDDLSALQAKVDTCRQAAFDLIKRFGAKTCAWHPYKLAGGLGGIQLDNMPEGWKVVDKKYPYLYMPKKSKENKQLLEEIAALPTVDYDELNKLVNFKQGSYSDGGNIYWSQAPGLKWGKEYHLIETAAPYDPHPEMEEILVSEYSRLSKELDSK